LEEKNKSLPSANISKGKMAKGSLCYDPEEMASIIVEERGFVTRTARRMGVSLSTVYNGIKKFPVVAEALEMAREREKDNVENKMYDRIDEGSDKLIQFYLSTVGKDRGYGLTTHIKNEQSGEIKIEYVNNWRGSPVISETNQDEDDEDSEDF
jgi:hypothetical protein